MVFTIPSGFFCCSFVGIIIIFTAHYCTTYTGNITEMFSREQVMFSTAQWLCHKYIGHILLQSGVCISKPRYVACESVEKDNDFTGATDN